MAVARFTLPADQHRIMARMLAPSHPRGAKELERAATRPGKMAELTESEFRALYELAPWGTRTMDVLDEALFELEVASGLERTRPRGAELGMAPHASFHARLTNRLNKKEHKRNA